MCHDIRDVFLKVLLLFISLIPLYSAFTLKFLLFYHEYLKLVTIKITVASYSRNFDIKGGTEIVRSEKTKPNHQLVIYR